MRRSELSKAETRVHHRSNDHEITTRTHPAAGFHVGRLRGPPGRGRRADPTADHGNGRAQHRDGGSASESVPCFGRHPSVHDPRAGRGPHAPRWISVGPRFRQPPLLPQGLLADARCRLFVGDGVCLHHLLLRQWRWRTGMYRRGMGKQAAGGFRNPGPGSTYGRKDRRRVVLQGRTRFVGGNRPGPWVLPSGDGIRAGRFPLRTGQYPPPMLSLPQSSAAGCRDAKRSPGKPHAGRLRGPAYGGERPNRAAIQRNERTQRRDAEARRSPFHATPMPTTLGDLGSPHSHPALDPGTGRADGTLSRGRVFALTAIGAVVGHSVGWYWFLNCYARPCPGNLIRTLVGPVAVAVGGPTVGSAIAGGDVSDSLGGSALGMVGSFAVYSESLQPALVLGLLSCCRALRTRG